MSKLIIIHIALHGFMASQSERKTGNRVVVELLTNTLFIGLEGAGRLQGRGQKVVLLYILLGELQPAIVLIQPGPLNKYIVFGVGLVFVQLPGQNAVALQAHVSGVSLLAPGGRLWFLGVDLFDGGVVLARKVVLIRS